MARTRSWRWHQLLLAVVGALIAVLTLAGGAFAYDLQQFRSARARQLLPGAVIGGLHVGEMTREEALATIAADLAPRLDRSIILRAGHRDWITTPRRLGATTNAEAAVDAAFESARNASWLAWAGLRWGRRPVRFEADLRITRPDAGARALVERIAKELAVSPRNARLKATPYGPRILPAARGQRVVVTQLADRLLAALDGTSSKVLVPLQPVEPKVTEAHFSQILFLQQRAHRLDLYLDGRRVKSYPVAVGTGNYPTPTGIYHVTRKRVLPEWVNPAPNGWGRGLPRRIAPGPNNPLGLRALYWSGGGAIRFHGTADVDSIGRDASHGCVRLTNTEVVDLFRRVEVGAHIVSVR